MPSIVLAEIVFSWGYILKPPFLALGGRSLPYPAPTTLVGALAYPYVRSRGDTREVVFINKKPYSPAIMLLDKVRYAVMGYPKPSTTQVTDMNRYASYSYLKSEHRKNMRMWFAVMGVGKNYIQHKSVIAYAVDSKWSIEIGRTAWGITRIGSKEGLVSVTRVTVIDKPKTISSRIVRTIFPIPASIVKTPLRSYDKIRLWKLSRETYSSTSDPEKYMEEYYVPRHPGGVYGGEMIIEADQERSIVYDTQYYGPLVVPRDIVGDIN